jgi:hypothetical protein
MKIGYEYITYFHYIIYNLHKRYYIPFILTLLGSYTVLGFSTFYDPYYIVTIISYFILIFPLFFAHVMLGLYSSGLANEGGTMKEYCEK